MNTLMNMNTNEQMTMSSKQISELVGSRHDTVKKSIERLKNQGVITFTSMAEKSLGGRPGTTYHVNERDSYIVVAQLSPEFTARLVDEWKAMKEQKFQIPTTLSGALRLAAEQAETIEEQERMLLDAKPKVEFVDHYVDVDGTETLTAVAKIFKTGPRVFSKHLQNDGIVYRLSGELVPMQKYIDKGYFVVKTGTSNDRVWKQTRVTPKGISWLAKLYGIKESKTVRLTMFGM